MRILHVTECYRPVMNGVATSAALQAAWLRDHGHEVTILTPEMPGRGDQPGTVSLPSWQPKTSPYTFFKYDWYRQHGAEATAAIQSDLVHVHHPFFAGLIALAEARRRNVPLVFQAHTDYARYSFHHMPPGLKDAGFWFSNFWVGWFAGKCDHIIAPSEYTKHALLSYGVKRPITVIPTAPQPTKEVSRSRSEVRGLLGIPEDAEVLLFVGRLSPEKNLRLLMRAYEHLRLERENLWLVLIGGGPLERSLRKTADAHVVFTGSLPHSETLGYYAGADLFVFPSETDTQGMVTLEAMQHGVPCVVTPEGGAYESLGHGKGGVVAKGQPRAWVRAIRELLDDPARLRELGRSAREHAAGFTVEAMMEQITAVYAAASENRE